MKLVQADCQNLPKMIPNDHFDLAVVEDGIFVWIKNLDAWMRSAYRVLKSRGRLIVSDYHPISKIVEEKGGSVTFRKSYFDQQPEIYREENLPVAVEFLWKLSDIINAAIRAGFRIDCIEEYYFEREEKSPPLLQHTSFSSRQSIE